MATPDVTATTNDPAQLQSSQATAEIVVREPDVTDKQGYTQPPSSFLDGKWHVTHSSLPMWKSKRNVSITYTGLPPSGPPVSQQLGTDRLDDLVEYQELSSDKVHSIKGIDKPSDEARRDGWVWRGKGLLMAITSRWQVLAWGEEDGGNRWVVTYFAKTLFTPAGVDFYSRDRAGLAEGTVKGIERALAASGSDELKELAKGVFEVKMD